MTQNPNDSQTKGLGTAGVPAFTIRLLLRYCQLLERHVALLETRSGNGRSGGGNGTLPDDILVDLGVDDEDAPLL